MLFIFKEKPIVITAVTYTDYSATVKFNPISPALNHVPKWWKNTPPSKFNWDKMKPQLTVKSCPGISSSFKKGFIMPMWSDLAIKTNFEHYSYSYSDRMSKLDHHVTEQSPDFYEDYWHFKLQSPWYFKTPVDLIYTTPFYCFNSPLPYVHPPGIIPQIDNTCATNFFIFVKRTLEESNLFLSSGTPLYHIIPLTEKKVELKIEILCKEDYLKLANPSSVASTFINKGVRAIANLKKKK